MSRFTLHNTCSLAVCWSSYLQLTLISWLHACPQVPRASQITLLVLGFCRAWPYIYKAGSDVLSQPLWFMGYLVWCVLKNSLCGGDTKDGGCVPSHHKTDVGLVWCSSEKNYIQILNLKWTMIILLFQKKESKYSVLTKPSTGLQYKFQLHIFVDSSRQLCTTSYLSLIPSPFEALQFIHCMK